MTKGTVSGVVSNMVTIRVDGPVMQGEICYIETGGDRLMAEVIKVTGQDAFVQVFESTCRVHRAHARDTAGARDAQQEL